MNEETIIMILERLGNIQNQIDDLMAALNGIVEAAQKEALDNAAVTKQGGEMIGEEAETNTKIRW